MYRKLKRAAVSFGFLTALITNVTIAQAVTLDETTILNANDGFVLSTGGPIFLDPVVTQGCWYDVVIGGACAALNPYTLAGYSFTHATIAEIGNLLNAIDSPAAFSNTAPTSPTTIAASTSTDSDIFFNGLSALGAFQFEDIGADNQIWQAFTADYDTDPSYTGVYSLEHYLIRGLDRIDLETSVYSTAGHGLPDKHGNWLKLVPIQASEAGMFGLFAMGGLMILAFRRKNRPQE